MDHKPYKLIDLPRVNDPRGNLSFIEGGNVLPFEIERCYWIYDVPGGMEQGRRALRDATELIVALSGSFDVVVEGSDGVSHTVHLCRSYKGLLIPPGSTRAINNFSTNSVAMVLSSKVEGDDASTVRVERPSDGPSVLPLPRQLSPNGSVTEVENTGAYPFGLKRVFYLYDVPADSERGGHSHYEAQELIVAASGSFDVTLHNGQTKHTYTLDRPYQALYIPPGYWRTLENFSGGSVCLVLTSEKYSEADYCRDFGDFLRIKQAEAVPQAPKKVYKFMDLADCDRPYRDELREAAMRVIDSGRYIGGPEVEGLESTLCRLTGAPYAVGVSNGLDALRLILRGYIELGRLRPGDEVIVPANTYFASVLAVTDSGLTPVFVEPDPATFNLDSQLVESAITDRTRAVMPVHLYGRACWDATLADVVRRHDLIVVEDNAQAIGAEAPLPGLFGGRLTGGLGHAAAFSFYPTKNIGALGDAGAVVTHDEALARAVAALRNYGSDYRYHNIYEGLNCRLDPMQAAVLRVKLRHLDQETDHRRAIARTYDECITNPAVRKPLIDAVDGSVWHQYVVRVGDRDAFRKYLADNGVQTDVHYATPPHLQPCYQRYSHLDLPVTCQLADEVVSLPVSRCTSVEDAREIAAIINRW